MELPTPGDAVLKAHVERDLAPGPVGRKDRRSRACPHLSLDPSPGSTTSLAACSLQRHLAADFVRIEVRAIAGILDRAPVHDRKIVAELAGKVEILFDQHDRDVA